LAITTATAPATPGAINGLATVCPSTSVTYSITAVTNASSYTWTAPTNATITAGQGTTSVTITYASAFTSGTLSVIATGCGGTSTARTLVITTAPAPATPGAINGLATVCAGSSGTYSITAVTNATSYTWTLPTGMSFVANTSTTGTSIQVVFANNFTGGTLSVVANNCSGSSASVSRVITANALPTQPGPIAGPTVVCARQRKLVYSVAASPGVTFNWTVPTGCTINSGAGTNSIVVRWGTVAGTISVTKTNGCGTSVASTLAVSIGACRIVEPSETKSFNVIAYPNPFTENFVIEAKTDSSTMIDIKVFDMVGRLIEERSVEANALEMTPMGNRYPSGVYNIVVTQDDEVKTLRVVKR
jgi:hypothetical protein